MRIRPKLLTWLAILFVFFGLACNPISSLTALNSTSTDTPAPTNNTPVAIFPTRAAAPTATERSVQVDALYVTSGTPATGGTSPIEIRVRPATTPGQLRVGFLEGEVGGTGPQWHAAGWEAVLIASMLSGIDPTNYEFTFSVGGRIDGPSAGALMTIGVLAALRGDTPRPEATMTGTINPDGTVGPVGGIPQKMQGAARKGKKLVLVPIGQRYDQDENTKQMVDVVAEGNNLGMNVQEVGNIYDAYQQIVGKPLPRPSVSPVPPQFPARAFDNLKAKLADWYSRYDQERTQVKSFSAPIQQYLASDVQYADQAAAKSTNDLNQGLVGLAYFEITDAVSRMRQADADGTLTQDYTASGFNSAVNYLESLASAQSDLDSAVNEIQLHQPKTVSDAIGLFDTYSNLGAAEGLLVGVQDRIAALRANLSKNTRDQTLLALMNIAEDMVSADNYVQIARDSVDFETGYGSVPTPTTAKVVAVAETLSRAGDANLALFDSTEIAPAAQQLGTTDSAVKNQLMGKDADYRFTLLSSQGEQVLDQQMKSGMQEAAMLFGNAQNIYAYSSGLIAKYYSLDAKMDSNFQVTSYQNEKALGSMLDFADERAKELITLCGSEVPVPAILYYENAHALRQGSASDQLTALNYYWQAVALAQADAFMTGKFSTP